MGGVKSTLNIKYKVGDYLGKNSTIKMTEEEKIQWDNLYQYVKKEVLLYDKNQSIPNNIILRLKGLKNGKLIANNKTQNNAEYSFEIILYTFKMCKQSINAAISSKEFTSEMNKFMYISAIIENNINDVYMRISNAKKSQEKTQSIIVDNIYNEGADYKRKTEDNKVGNKLEELW